MNHLALFAGHDANITMYNSQTNKYHIIELERVKKQRYFRLHVDNTPQSIFNDLRMCNDISKSFWYFDKPFETCSFTLDGYVDFDIVRKAFDLNCRFQTFGHHFCHAASCFYQSPFNDCLIFSYDGGGDDGFFNVYRASFKNGIQLIEKVSCDFGGGYLLMASCLKEIVEKSRHQLSLAGKFMGICAYGKVNEKNIEPIADFYFDKDFHKLGQRIGVNFVKRNPWEDVLHNNIFEGQEGYDFAATAQKAFEEAFLRVFKRIILQFKLPVCITGGAALNVLLNERIKNDFGVDVYVPPNPNDCGLSLGALLLNQKPQNKIEVTYNGVPLLDRNKVDFYIKARKAIKVNSSDIVKLLKSGKIIGICYGDSEVGPRALGNRSIICDPSYPDMKDILNSKVKFREWYRPFAPFCKQEDANKFFQSANFEYLEYMSFAPMVKEDFRNKLISITHIDGTSRLQTVTQKSHPKFYEILNEFSKVSEVPVLLNTSFNIKGSPILTTIEDSLYVLDNTQLDYVVIEDFLFTKE